LGRETLHYPELLGASHMLGQPQECRAARDDGVPGRSFIDAVDLSDERLALVLEQSAEHLAVVAVDRGGFRSGIAHDAPMRALASAPNGQICAPSAI
jgi:hypothetical protein